MIQTKEELEALCFSERSAFLDFVPSRDKRVLDIGCGDGRFTLEHFTDAATILGLDPKQEEIDTALNSAQNLDQPSQRSIDFICADIVEHPLAPSSLDLAIFLRSF